MQNKLPKSTSDDSHLADDSKQESQLKDWQVVMEGTSDDTHLAHSAEMQHPFRDQGLSSGPQHWQLEQQRALEDAIRSAANTKEGGVLVWQHPERAVTHANNDLMSKLTMSQRGHLLAAAEAAAAASTEWMHPHRTVTRAPLGVPLAKSIMDQIEDEATKRAVETYTCIGANLPKSTSDDSHLASDSKRQESAAGSAGYAPQVQEERRVAADGHSYTHQEFLEHYDEEWKATIEWNAAKNTHPPAPPLPPPPTPPPPAAAVNTLLSPRTAQQLRACTNIASTCKKDMRAFLDATSRSQPTDPEVFAFDIPANVSWRNYIARHSEWERIVGSGITRAQLIFLPEIRDPNRDKQLRLDYVFENRDGGRCQLHPGNKG